jgi:hypothetical protein
MSQTKIGDSYTPEETARRRDETIRRMLATPPTPHSEMKIGKSKWKSGKSLKSISAQSKKRRRSTDGA